MSAVPVPKRGESNPRIQPDMANMPVDNRRANTKPSDLTKYTDVRRTSSASFKPPMTKESLKPQVQPQPKDSSWFAPFSYIKTMFGTKPANAPANATNVEKNNKNINKINNKTSSPQPKKTTVKNTSHKPESKYSRYTSDLDDGKPLEGNMQSALLVSADETRPISISPSFSVSPNNAITKRDQPVNTSSVFEMEDDNDPSGGKYKSINGDKASTYLHTPDKKGTTSFRITTQPKLGPKQTPTILSPSFSSHQQKKTTKPINRKGSTSPKKTRADSGSSRLRSKSTPDSSSMKPRPVSASSTIPKSISLKNTSQKNNACTPPIKEVKAVVQTNNKRVLKPTFSYNANALRDNANLATARSNIVGNPRSPIQINHTSSSAFAARKTSMGEAPINAIQNICSSNSTLRSKEHTVLLLESPTFPKPSLQNKAVPTTQTKKHNDIVEKFQKTRTMVNDKLKSRSQIHLKKENPNLKRDKIAPVPAVQIKIPNVISQGTMPDRPSFDSSMSEIHGLSSKTITLCQAALPALDKSDHNLRALDPWHVRAVDVHNQIEEENHNLETVVPCIDPTHTEIDDCNVTNMASNMTKHPCIRMVNSSQVHPKHPTKPQVFNVSNRKQSSFTDLLVADKKDKEQNGESTTVIGYSAKINTGVAKNNSQSALSVQNLSNIDKDEDAMITVPSFYNTCNNASSGDKVRNYAVYEIDAFVLDFNEDEQNTCNSAHSGLDPIPYDAMSKPTSFEDDIDVDNVYEIPFGPSIVPWKISEDLPSNRLADGQGVSECYSSSSLAENSRASRRLQRKYPGDLDLEKVKESKRVVHPPVKKTPVLSSPRPASTVSYRQSAKKLSVDQSPNGMNYSSTLKLLQRNEKVSVPTILEPSSKVLVLDKKPAGRSSSRSPSNRGIHSFASSVGDALGAISSAFQSSFMGKPPPSKKVENKPSSPDRSQPTKIVEKPLSATRSYVNSVLDDKGITSKVESGISTFKSFINSASNNGNVKKEGDKKKRDEKDKVGKVGKDKQVTLTASTEKKTKRSKSTDPDLMLLDNAPHKDEKKKIQSASIIPIEKKPTVTADIGKKLGAEMSPKKRPQSPEKTPPAPINSGVTNPKNVANKEVKAPVRRRTSLDKLESLKYPGLMKKYDPNSHASMQTRLGEIP